MEVGRNYDGLIVPGVGYGASEDDHEGRGTSPSLAPFLARLSRDERLGWTRTRADDTESLNVNVSDCGSCHLSEVSSVSSWLNDASALDDDYSSCPPDEETGSEKDDVDDDEEDTGPEIRPLFLLQRCLEEKLLEQQQNSIFDCAVAANKSYEQSFAQSDAAVLETNTIKRASRNLFTFKSAETADRYVPNDISDTSGVSSSSQSMPLRSSGNRCDPDSIVCTGAVFDFNLTSDKAGMKVVKSGVVNGERNDLADDRRHMMSVQQRKLIPKPVYSSHAVRSAPPEAPIVNDTSPVKGAGDTSCSQSVPKHRETDNKRACRDLEQNKSPIRVCIANGSICRKQIYNSPISSCNVDNSYVRTSQANDDGCQMDLQCRNPSSVKTEQQESLQNAPSSDKSATLNSAEVAELETSTEANAENVDTASVVSDEAEKAADQACSLIMPSVEDGLSNSDISDVDEAFSMFAGLKPQEPVPVDTSFGAKSPVVCNRMPKDADGNAADAGNVSNR